MEKDHYVIWAKLFETHARATRVLHHIIPQIRKERSALIDIDHKEWTSLDSTIFQWIYSTIFFSSYHCHGERFHNYGHLEMFSCNF